jgi:hypothetical protein
VGVPSRCEIRARVEDGDADSIINLLQFGTTFTKQRRITERGTGRQVRQAGTGVTVFVPSPLLKARIEDFVAALASPGENERLRFARRVIERRGMELATRKRPKPDSALSRTADRGRGQCTHAGTLVDPDAELRDLTTIFRDRGLASDTAIWIDFGIERALEAMKARQLIQPSAVRRIAILGPGLDFADKQEGQDFYPEQTLQPFALVDSLMRLGLSASGGLQVTAFDLSPRVLQHLETARMRARSGTPYTLVFAARSGSALDSGLDEVIGRHSATALAPSHGPRRPLRRLAGWPFGASACPLWRCCLCTLATSISSFSGSSR